MDAATENVYSSSIDTGEVNNLLAEISGEVGLNQGMAMGNNVGTGVVAGAPVAQPAAKVDDMEQRLAALQNI